MSIQPGHNYDMLTGLANYGGFIEYLETLTASAAKDGNGFCLAVVDIDMFGQINEEHGQSVGDAVLKSVADHLREGFPDAAMVSRCGGDAFAILLDNCEKEDAFLQVEAARAGYSAGQVVEADGRQVQLQAGISVGLASYPDDAARELELIRKANEALYRAKVGGRSRTCLAREERMVTKTTHYTQGQLQGLSRLSKRDGIGEAALLREALDDLLRKHNA